MTASATKHALETHQMHITAGKCMPFRQVPRCCFETACRPGVVEWAASEVLREQPFSVGLSPNGACALSAHSALQ
jgi:hypothetical protein